MKQKITKWFYPLLAAVILLFIIALIIGLRNGVLPEVLLIVATCIMVALLLEATWTKHSSFFKYAYRFGLFWGLWTALFYSQGETVLMQICGLLTLIALMCVFGNFVYYMNKYSVPDAEKHLDD